MSDEYRVLAGIHVQDGKTYRAGTRNCIVESERDLEKIFPGKFESVSMRRTRRTSTSGDEEVDTKGVELMIAPKGGGWYDVVNEATGNPVNTRSLRKKEALMMIDKAVEDKE